METTHKIFFNSASNMSSVKDESVNLIVTSPPYPMIDMWDNIMSSQNPKIADALLCKKPRDAFELMHKELDTIWKECYRVLADGGFLCINIGDATRTIDGDFQLYNNHSRIVKCCSELGFSNLPNIIWKKQTNAPNKFMGSGMLPCGAYVTLEHEYILIFRKGFKRAYKTEEQKSIRRKSSFFWEERNEWFSDTWDLKGTKQKIENSTSRERSAAFPLEIPYRLINMYSQQGDVVLDPFLGTGTTCVASMLLGRNSIGFEIDIDMSPIIDRTISGIKISSLNQSILRRYQKHLEFVAEREASHGTLKHYNNSLSCAVMTAQEHDIEFHYLINIRKVSNSPMIFNTEYEDNSDINTPPPLNGKLL